MGCWGGRDGRRDGEGSCGVDEEEEGDGMG